MVVSWNVQTLLDGDNCPERRTALIAKELVRYSVDVAALRRLDWRVKDNSRKVHTQFPGLENQ